MTLSYYCKSCAVKNLFKTKATNRFELQQELGADEINRRCDYCGNIEKRHINRLTAQPNKTLMILSVVLVILLTTTIFMFGFIAALTFTFPIWLFFDAQKRASLFNKTMIRRR
ncbi:MAG: hypothetical protein MK211_03020 [Flavobacteriales bacterium]|nr:hypothetical protein [Flavobacteriales bacterium]